jgi:Na+/H+-dicarboxylate symporter
MSENSGASLTAKILMGMVLGLVVGVAWWFIKNHEILSAGLVAFMDAFVFNGVINVLGKIFVASLKLLVVPLVLVSLICGVASLSNSNANLGRISIKTILFYLLTTCMAISLAMLMAAITRPGIGANLEATNAYSVAESKPFVEVVIDIFPTNPFASFTEGNMLQIIVFAVLIGLALTKAGNAGERILATFRDWDEVIMKLVMMMMHFAPIGVFCLIAKIFAEQGLDILGGVAMYFLTVAGVLVLHAMVVYPILLKFLSGLSPFIFLRKMRETQMFAFSTASSNATIPVSLATCEKRLGCNESVAAFTIPLGATINMDGTSIMQGVATVFIAQAFGVDMTMLDYVTVVVMATLASIGTAGVPGVGLIMLTMVLNQVGLPVEGIALIIGVDRLLDMVRTAVNITGDCVVTCIVAKTEGEMNLEVYNNPDIDEEGVDHHQKAA